VPFAPVGGVGCAGAGTAGVAAPWAFGWAGTAFALAAALPAFAFGLAAVLAAALACFGLAAEVLAAAFGLATEVFDAAVDGLAAADDAFAVADALVAVDEALDAVVDDLAAPVVRARLALAVPAREVPEAGFAPAARTVREDDAVAVRAAVVLAPVVPERVAAPAGIAVDIALAASVSDLTAVCIALVAELIACSAVVIVLADVVAFVAAVFSCAAADVTLVAAVVTVRVVGAVLEAVVRRLAVPVRAALFVAVPVLADVRLVAGFAAGLVAGLAAALFVAGFFAALDVDDFAVPVRLALAVRGRVGFLAAAVVGTDLPPSGSVTGSLIPRCINFYTSALLAHAQQQPLSRQRHALAPTSATVPAASARAFTAQSKPLAFPTM
jgi:hypothetical protein